MIVRWFVVVMLALLSPGARAITVAEGELLTSMVATSASRDARVDVLTMADLQKAVALAADRQLVDCRAAEACLAEVAAAMDAAAVIHGKVGVLGTQVVLNLALFDTTTSTAVGRGADTGALMSHIDDAVAELLAKLPAPGKGARVRVLVLDIDLAGARPATATAGDAAAATADPAASPGGASAGWGSAPAQVGIGLTTLGVGSAAVSLGLCVVAYLADTEADGAAVALTAQRAYARRNDLVGWSLVAGGVALVAGGGGLGLLGYARTE